jgi:hypothetical protein
MMSWSASSGKAVRMIQRSGAPPASLTSAYTGAVSSAIFGRHEPTTLRAMAALLHKEALCPKEDKPLLDALDAASYRNANAVSDDLKYALRESIELLGNEVLYYYRTHHVPGVEAEEIDAADLSIQCVRYMYRLLFLFFMESRPELGYAPIKENTYFSALERAEKIKETEKIFAELVNWVHDTLEIENNPYIRVIAVLKGVQQ